MSAVASIPWPGPSPSTTASWPSGQRQEVVDVASHLDARGGLVDRADLEPGHPRAARGAEASAASCRQTPSAGGRAARCRSRGLPGRQRRAPSRRRSCRCGAPDRARRPSRSPAARMESRSGPRRRSTPARGMGRATRTTTRACAHSRIEDERLSHSEQPPTGKLLHRLVSRYERTERPSSRGSATWIARATSWSPRSSCIRTTAASASSSSTAAASQPRASRRARGSERTSVRSRRGPGDAWRIPARPRAPARARGEALRSLVQLRVLNGDRELARERREERRLIAASSRPRGRYAARSPISSSRATSGTASTRRSAPRGRPRAPMRGEHRPGRRARQHPLRPKGPNASSSSRSCDRQLHPLQRRAPPRAGASFPRAGRPRRALSAAAPRRRDGRLQRVGERELGDRLADDDQQRLRPLELERHRLGPARRPAAPGLPELRRSPTDRGRSAEGSTPCGKGSSSTPTGG